MESKGTHQFCLSCNMLVGVSAPQNLISVSDAFCADTRRKGCPVLGGQDVEAEVSG